jgi:hypothetical protein
MTKIRVGLDVAGIQSDLSQVEQAGKKVQEALKGGKIGLDATADKKALTDLHGQAEALADKLGDLFDLEIIDPDSLAAGTKALERAADAADSLEEAITGKPATGTYGLRKYIEEARLLEKHLRQVGKAQEILAREGVKLTRKEIEERKRLYEDLRRSGTFGTGRLRTLEFDEALAGGERLLGGRLHRLVREETQLPQGVRQHLGAFVGGIGRTAGAGVLSALAPGNVGTQILHQTTREALAAEGGLFSGQGLKMLGTGTVVGGLAYGAVKAVQGVRQHMDGARNEAITLSDLRHSLGAVSTDFDLLRDSVHDLTDGFGIAHHEAANLAREMAHTSGVVGEDLKTGAGFARGYGIEPGQGTRFFAEMRHLGVSKSDADNRRLALLIGEAVNRGSITNRVDDVLAAVEDLTTVAARQSLTKPNAEGYVGAISDLTASGLPGLKGDPGAAGRLLAAIDAALRQGGAAGEASKNFTLGMLQREFKSVSALDVGIISEGGAFGTVSDAVGSDSPAYKLAEAMGDTGTVKRYRQMVAEDTHRTNLDRAIRGHLTESQGNADFFRKSLAAHTGITEDQAAALGTAYLKKGGLGRLEKLAGRELDIKHAAPMAEVLFGGPEKVKAQWERLKDEAGISDEEKAQIQGQIDAGGYGNDAVVEEIARLTGQFGAGKDEGEKAREAQISLDREFQKFAAKIIPLTTSIQEGIVEMVRMLPTESAKRFVDKQDQEKTLREAKDRTPEDIKKAAAAFGAAKTPEERREVLKGLRELDRQHPDWHTDEYRKALDKMEQGLDASEKGGAAGKTSAAQEWKVPAGAVPGKPAEIADARAELKRMGYSDEQASGIIGNLMQESGMRTTAVGDHGAAFGLAQWRDERLDGLKEYATRHGLGPAEMKAQLGYLDYELQHGESRAGRKLKAATTAEEAAIAMLDFERPRGWSRNNPLGADAADRRIGYARKVQEAVDLEADNSKIPPDVRTIKEPPDPTRDKIPTEQRDTLASVTGKQQFAFSHTITLQDPRGNPLMEPIIQTNIGAPIPAGVAV